MNNINDGGSAFPQKEPLSSDCQGMTLLDYFAAKAMQGMLSNSEHMLIAAPSICTALNAYEYAHAMIQAREDVYGEKS